MYIDGACQYMYSMSILQTLNACYVFIVVKALLQICGSILLPFSLLSIRRVVVQLISYHIRDRIQFKCEPPTPMHLACQNGHEQVVKAIATMVPEWIDANDDTWTPLHMASVKGYVQVVETLVNHKATFKAVNGGITPIHLAVKKGYIDVVRVLLSAYPDEVNTPDENGKTPLHLAAKHCGDQPGIVTKLLER